MKEITFNAYFPQISGAFKSTAEGGARITLELDPLAAAQVYGFKVGADRQQGGPLEVTIKLGEIESY